MQYYGVDLKIDKFDDIEEVQYLGSKVFRNTYKQNIILPPAPPLLVYHDLSQTLLRQSAYRWYQAKTHKDGTYKHFDEIYTVPSLQEQLCN
ncbi:9943_t:CDS:2 [Racocetra fulgida]|uniref:9943_t:CDS:1 n=1 Tax=Racocetra fulgida TaxID=60492 RepID=A0A9N9AAL3_9GLOM|nr:9943_t:CDS:2 [Racocetra fulgida]